MQDLKVALVQTDLVWENKMLNLSNIEKSISLLPADIDVIILPEMFNTGFTMNPAPNAETMEGVTLMWMKKISHEKNAVLTGSLIIAEGNGYYNRLIWMLPDGSYSYFEVKKGKLIFKKDLFNPKSKPSDEINIRPALKP